MPHPQQFFGRLFSDEAIARNAWALQPSSRPVFFQWRHAQRAAVVVVEMMERQQRSQILYF